MVSQATNATNRIFKKMNVAGIILFVIWVSLCVVIIGGWAFKTLDDDSVVIKWDDDEGRWIDVNQDEHSKKNLK